MLFVRLCQNENVEKQEKESVIDMKRKRYQGVLFVGKRVVICVIVK